MPDNFTAVAVRPLSSPTFPFLGSDGKYHVVYDLELTNATAVPATIEKLDVVDAVGPGDGDRFVSRARGWSTPTARYGDCNRLRAAAASD